MFFRRECGLLLREEKAPLTLGKSCILLYLFIYKIFELGVFHADELLPGVVKGEELNFSSYSY